MLFVRASNARQQIMLIFLTLVITVYKIKNMPALPSVTSLFYGFSLLLTIPTGKHWFMYSSFCLNAAELLRLSTELIAQSEFISKLFDKLHVKEKIKRKKCEPESWRRNQIQLKCLEKLEKAFNGPFQWNTPSKWNLIKFVVQRHLRFYWFHLFCINLL